jgi:hypothetical protein
MKKEPYIKRFIWDTKRVHWCIKEKFKRKGSKITSPEINAIWKSYVEEAIVKPLEKGDVVYLSPNARLWVKATPAIDNKRFVSLLEKGLMYSQGRIVKADINFDTSDYIHSVVFETKLWKSENKLYFTPHPNIKKRVRESIIKGQLITRTYL